MFTEVKRPSALQNACARAAIPIIPVGRRGGGEKSPVNREFLPRFSGEAQRTKCGPKEVKQKRRYQKYFVKKRMKGSKKNRRCSKVAPRQQRKLRNGEGRYFFATQMREGREKTLKLFPKRTIPKRGYYTRRPSEW